MSDWRYWQYAPTVRRQAKEGIKAKSQRGQIGETWWSGRFIKILESFDIGARLTRGRSYARSGQVMKLTIKAGLVTASVQGSHPTPYKVRLEIVPFDEADWKRVEERMAEQALFMAKLLAGEMPREIEEAFEACELSLFPQTSRNLASDCSCPDWSNPCKHIAAVYYILAEKFDDDPFLIFAWRGRTKEILIERLRHLRGADNATEQSASESSGLDVTSDAPPLAACLENFWSVGAEFHALHFNPHAAAVPDALVRQLGQPPINIKGRKVEETLSAFYEQMTDGAERKAFD